MKSILLITSSLRGPAARSTLLARELVERLAARQPGVELVTRDVVSDPIHPLDAQALAALGKPAAERSAAERALVADYDALIAELWAADAVVLGVPMYNFAIPSQLKTYFDAVARSGVTFRYGPDGAEGLLTGKKVYVVFGRGGIYRGTPADLQTPYLQTMLHFLGLHDVEYVFAEGLDMGPQALRAGLASARQTIATL